MMRAGRRQVQRSTASPSPAASAWWASRATSGPASDRRASAASAFLCKATFAFGGNDLDREAGKLVAECNLPRFGHEHAGGQAFLEPVGGLPRHFVEKPELGVGRRDRDCLEQRPRRRTDARHASEYRVRTVGGISSSPAASTSVTKKGVAGGRAVELVRIEPVRLGELGYRSRGKRREPQAGNLLARPEFS